MAKVIKTKLINQFTGFAFQQFFFYRRAAIQRETPHNNRLPYAERCYHRHFFNLFVLPAAFSGSRHRHVTIWCDLPFNLPFY